MGNCHSISCCHPRRRARNDSRNQTPGDIAKCSSESINVLLCTGISDPPDLQKLSEQLEKINLEILKEQRIKEGAKKICRVVTDKKHLADVEDFLEKSKRKLQHLYSIRQEINGYIEIHGEKHLPEEPEDYKTSVHEAASLAPAVEDDNNEQSPSANLDVDKEAPSLSDEETYHTALSWISPPSSTSSHEEPEKSKTSVHEAASLPPVVEDDNNEQSPSANLDVDKEAPSLSDEETYHTVMSLTPPPTSTSSHGEPLSEDSDVYFTASSTSVKGIEEMNRELSVRSQSVSPLSLEDFRCCAVLGRGGFGKVLLAEHKTSKKMVAIKALKKIEIVKEKLISRLLCEKNILQTASSARHPFLVNMIACFQDKDRIFFTLEYAAGGDLRTLYSKIDGGFPEHIAEFYAACIVLGVEYLHENNIAHRDLKMENIVLDRRGFAKITDFGISKAGMGHNDRTTSICGTLSYMAPEIIKRLPYTRVVDWWSVGIIIYEMLAGKRPFVGRTKQQRAKCITDSAVTYLGSMSHEATLLIRALLEKNPALRLGAQENDVALVKQQPFFALIDWNQLLSRQMRPPYIPPISGPEDVSNFRSKFTSTDPVLTLLTGQDILPEEQEAFEGFEWISEGAL